MANWNENVDSLRTLREFTGLNFRGDSNLVGSNSGSVCEPQWWVAASIMLLVPYCENQIWISPKKILHGRYQVAKKSSFVSPLLSAHGL